MNNSNLLPCPFCGSDDVDINCDSTADISWSVDNAQVECNGCEATTGVFWSDKYNKESCDKAIKEAIDAWNKRTYSTKEKEALHQAISRALVDMEEGKSVSVKDLLEDL